MAKDYSKKFYNSKLWKDTRNSYGIGKMWLCENCFKPATIVHHIKHLNKNNIDNYNITINSDNLKLLCIECHNTIHGRDIINNNLYFNSAGDLVEKIKK